MVSKMSSQFRKRVAYLFVQSCIGKMNFFGRFKKFSLINMHTHLEYYERDNKRLICYISQHLKIYFKEDYVQFINLSINYKSPLMQPCV